jgi:hypothetical protein
MRCEPFRISGRFDGRLVAVYDGKRGRRVLKEFHKMVNGIYLIGELKR